MPARRRWRLGAVAGARLGRAAAVLGGVMLIGIGVCILAVHLAAGT
jgi:putative Mn2+ efflux pump MntP